MTRFIPTARSLRALALAILVPPAVATVLVGVYLLVKYADSLHSTAFEPLVLYIFLTGLILSLGGCLLIGVPTHLLLRRMRWTGPWTYGALGLGGSIAILALSASTGGQWLPNDGIDTAMFCFTICGGPLAAYIFWRVARPDRSAALQHQP